MLEADDIKLIKDFFVSLDLSIKTLVAKLDQHLDSEEVTKEDNSKLNVTIPIKKDEKPIIVNRKDIKKIDLSKFVRNRNGILEIIKTDKEGNKYILHERTNPQLATIIPDKVKFGDKVEITTNKESYKGVVKTICNKELNKDFFFVLENDENHPGKEPWIQFNSIQSMKIINDKTRRNTK